MSWDPGKIRHDTIEAAWRAIHKRRKERNDSSSPPGFIISRDQKDALEMATAELGSTADTAELAGQVLWGVSLFVVEDDAPVPGHLVVGQMVDLRAAVQEG